VNRPQAIEDLLREAAPQVLGAVVRRFEPLAGHHRLHATRAHLLEMAGDAEAAVTEYRTAAERTTSVPEQHYPITQAARLGS
jgi:predicted RNA polymerase sigma factor